MERAVPEFDHEAYSAPPFDFEAPHDSIVMSPLPLSKGVRNDGMLPGHEPTLDPKTAGDAWTTVELSQEGIPKHYVLPTRPTDLAGDPDSDFMGDAVERFKRTGKHYGAFDTDERAAAFMKAHSDAQTAASGALPDSLRAAIEKHDPFRAGVSEAVKSFGDEPLLGFRAEDAQTAIEASAALRPYVGAALADAGVSAARLGGAAIDATSRLASAALHGGAALVSEQLQQWGVPAEHASGIADTIGQTAEMLMLSGGSETLPVRAAPTAPPAPRAAERPGLINEPRFQRRTGPDDDGDTFYSALERGIADAKLAKGNAQQWQGTLKNTPGVKGEELQWTGLDDWLKEQKGSVTKEQLLDFVKDHAIKVEEVYQGEPDPRLQKEEQQLIAEEEGINHQYNAFKEAGEPEAAEALVERWNQIHDRMREIDSERRRTRGAQYDQYKLKGGDEYRELLLTLPAKAQFDVRPAEGMYRIWDNNSRDWQRTPDGKLWPGYQSEAAAQTAASGLNTASGIDNTRNFRSSHFNQPNILAHVRFDEREGPQGERVLHIAEVQSDWHQKGREEGYHDPKAQAEATRLFNEKNEVYDTLQMQRNRIARVASDGRYYTREDLRNNGSDAMITKMHELERTDPDFLEAAQTYRDLNEAYTVALSEANKGEVPDAPFKKNWHELAMKHMLRYAAENGFDRVSWDTGKTNADRYRLSQRIGRVTLVRPKGYNADYLRAYDHDGDEVLNQEIRDPKELQRYVGRELADKLLAQEPSKPKLLQTVTADDLEIKPTDDGWETYSPDGRYMFVGKGTYIGRVGSIDEAQARAFAADQLNKQAVSTNERRTKQHVATRELEGLDVDVGGQGMKGFYDKILPEFMNKYVKKWGAQVEPSSLALNKEGWYVLAPKDNNRNAWLLKTADYTRPGIAFDTEAEARAALASKLAEGQTATHSVPVTPQMYDSVMQGQPLFKRGDTTAAPLLEGAKVEPDFGGKIERVYSPEMEQQRATVAQALRQRLDAIGLHDVGLRVADAINDVGDRGRRSPQDAYYFQNMINVALQDDPMSALNHEVIHALRAQNLFTDKEWALLEREAQKTWNAEHGIAEKYPGRDQAYQSEEGIAFAFAKWAKDKNLPQGQLQQLLQRVQQFFAAIKNGFKGEGFHTAESIFRKIDKGQLAERAAEPGMINDPRFAIRAYHGSPYKFDKFDLSKIGTGEGAQVYGHGLYFAGNENTALTYKHTLSQDRDYTLSDGSKLPAWLASQIHQYPVGHQYYDAAIDQGIKNFKGRIAENLEELSTSSQPWNVKSQIANQQAILDSLEKLKNRSAELVKPGHMYEVNIDAHPDQFLDWDKPLREQPPVVQNAWDKFTGSRIGTLADRSVWGALSQGKGQYADPTGKDFYGTFAEGLIGYGKPRPYNQVKAETSQRLEKQGIPGIKYLDQGSRAAGEGSRNYVVFDDNIVKIIRRYGLPLTAAGAAVAQQLLDASKAEAHGLINERAP